MTSTITPAHLGFLAIYNPSLSSASQDEDALAHQIVYYASVTTLSRRRRRTGRKRKGRRERERLTEDVSHEERNERLRQIGLAQGMVEFSRGFSGGDAVDVIETEKSRVVVHEVEPGWWILSSIDLTRLPLPPKLPTSSSLSQREDVFEYSSKEVKPAALLLQDLLRAHSLFLLHHDASLSRLFDRLGRRRFVSSLTRYWDLFLSTWSVSIHGNPIRSILGGINIAASGELGVGVGEEDRGSGEREVLEGLVGRIDGLVDLVVSKFGEADGAGDKNPERDVGEGAAVVPWLGTGQDPDAEDGAIFLGVGALTRQSLKDVVHWTEDLYTWGENSYGVIGAPSLTQSEKKQKAPSPPKSPEAQEAQAPQPSASSTADDSRAGDVGKDGNEQQEPDKKVTSSPDGAVESPSAPGPAPSSTNPEATAVGPEAEGHMGKFASMLKLGYGTYWSLGGSESKPGSPAPPEASQTDKPKSPAPTDTQKRSSTKKVADESEGYFLIGLKGTVKEHPPSDSSSDDDDETSRKHSTHTRTLHVTISSPDDRGPTRASLRAIVYINRPFIFTFLFRPETPSLSSDALYRSLHYQLSPLRKPLLISTTYRPPRPENTRPASSSFQASSSMYDLVWDPQLNNVHSTIPNIPTGKPTLWTRTEAIATHTHLLSIFSARKPGDVEKTLKTNKGWWIVWSRVLPPRASIPGASSPSQGGHDQSASASDVDDASEHARSSAGGGEEASAKEVFLLRRAGDHARAFSSSLAPRRESVSRLAQGIGVDTRGYVETLLSLGR